MFSLQSLTKTSTDVRMVRQTVCRVSQNLTIPYRCMECLLSIRIRSMNNCLTDSYKWSESWTGSLETPITSHAYIYIPGFTSELQLLPNIRHGIGHPTIYYQETPEQV